jgi:glyoxylase-like metal-dependent hydrolase (beta-lactamase superfamily II)
VPRVIALLHFDRVPMRHVRYSRVNVFARDKFTCQYCGKRPSRSLLNLDHVIPRSLGGKTVRASYLGRGHTSGDLVVLFVEDRVLHLGDLLFNHRYPRIDLEAGGSIEQWIGTLDRVLAMEGYDRVIPGHGAVTDREGVRQFQSFLREVWEQVSAAVRENRSLDETLRSVQLTQDAGYEAIAVPLVLRSIDLRRDARLAGSHRAIVPTGPDERGGEQQ